MSAPNPETDTPAPVVEKNPLVDPVAFAKSFREATDFQELDADLVVTEDPVGFIRYVDGQEQTYLDALEKARASGSNEALSYGVGRLGDHDFVGIIFNWNFMGASVGDVAAEKTIRAMDLARKNKLPVAVLYCSGGQRQQEASAALWGMDKVVHVVNQYKDETDQPLTAVIMADTFGGATASGLPQTDLIIGIEGRKVGFAGERIIKRFTGKDIGRDAQTVENSFLTNKIVQVILKDQTELLELLGTVFAAANRDKAGTHRDLHHEVSSFDFEGEGFKTPFMPRHPNHESRSKIQGIFSQHPSVLPEDIYETYQVLISDARRPDFLYFLRNGCDVYAPFFTGRIERDKWDTTLRYPAIAFALAAIKDPRLTQTLWFMAIGNQPSYKRQEKDGKIGKDPATENAWDYRNQVRMMNMAQRMRIPVFSFIDTPGASPTEEDEAAGLPGAMSDAYNTKDRFRGLSVTYVWGPLGSGGGGATTMWDRRVITSHGQIYVAPPKLAAEIVYKKPTDDDIKRTAITMRPNAAFLLSTDQMDAVIPEAEGGAGNDPLSLVHAVREDMIITYLDLGSLKPEEILKRRDRRIRNLKPIPMGHLSGQPLEHHRVPLDLERLFQHRFISASIRKWQEFPKLLGIKKS